MTYVLNVVYLILLAFFSPWLVYKACTTGKYRRGILRKVRGDGPRRMSAAPCVWFHGVSVGEIHLLRPIVQGFRRRHPDWECVISSTTDTGYDEAAKHFSDLRVFYWPLDFSWAVNRALRLVNPSFVVLAEGELWPNFLAAACKRGIAIALVNGRIGPGSFRNYERLRPLARSLFEKLDILLAQNADYAECYRRLGAPSDRVHVTGSVKYDGVRTDRQNAKTREMARLLGIVPGDVVWVAGSTQAPEEELVLGIYQRLRRQWPGLRLILVPRQKERFDEVASLLDRRGHLFVRRTELKEPYRTRDVVLVDTIGDLSSVWGLADVAFVGGSLDGHRGGQNMIEPAAYGAAVVFGPHVWNFRDTADRLVASGGAMQVADKLELEAAIGRLLGDAAERERLGSAASRFVRKQQGATERTLDYLDTLLAGGRWRSEAA